MIPVVFMSASESFHTVKKYNDSSTNSKRIRSYNLAGAHNSEKGRYLD